jgi:hypothetical protein
LFEKQKQSKGKFISLKQLNSAANKNALKTDKEGLYFQNELFLLSQTFTAVVLNFLRMWNTKLIRKILWNN